MKKFKSRMRQVVTAWRKAHPEYDQKQIAQMCGVNNGTFSRYLNGSINSVNLETWEKLATFFNCKGSDLFEIE